MKKSQLRKDTGIGEFTLSMVTDTPAELSSEQANYYRELARRYPEEAVYIYSFAEGRMLYASGWNEVLGYGDDEINLLALINSTCPEYAPFSQELNDKALLFIMGQREKLEQYSFMIELKKRHRNGSEVPLIVRVGVHKSVDGRVTEIIGRNQVNRSIVFGKVMRYAAYGPASSDFEETLNKELFHYYAISGKEKDALSLVAQGYSMKEIAAHYGVSKSAIDKRIRSLFKRFGVKSLPHLVYFAMENHILP